LGFKEEETNQKDPQNESYNQNDNTIFLLSKVLKPSKKKGMCHFVVGLFTTATESFHRQK